MLLWKKNILDTTKRLLWTRAFERLLWIGPIFLTGLEKKIHLSTHIHNFGAKLIKKTKRTFYNNLNVNKIANNKSFWKTIKPNFTDKTLKGEKILLAENDTTFSAENKVVEIFQSYFDGIVDGLNIKLCEISKEHSDQIINAIRIFEKHPSIFKLKELNSVCRFSFENLSLEDVKKVTRELDISKASQLLDIPTKIIKQNIDIFVNFSLPISIIL